MSDHDMSSCSLHYVDMSLDITRCLNSLISEISARNWMRGWSILVNFHGKQLTELLISFYLLLMAAFLSLITLTDKTYNMVYGDE